MDLSYFQTKATHRILELCLLPIDRLTLRRMRLDRGSVLLARQRLVGRFHQLQGMQMLHSPILDLYHL